MRHRILSIILTFALVLNLMGGASMVCYASEGPIEIRTVEDLYAVNDNLSADYILMNDIDLSSAIGDDGEYNYFQRGWRPIGGNYDCEGEAFTGTFDGNNHSISGLRINKQGFGSFYEEGSSKYFGLFAKNGGTIKNLVIGDGTIFVNGGNAQVKIYAGAVCGENSGNIENVYNKCDVTVIGSPYDSEYYENVSGVPEFGGFNRYYSDVCAGAICGKSTSVSKETLINSRFLL